MLASVSSKAFLKETAMLSIAVFFVAIFAQITVAVPGHNGDIPISGQSFAVLLIAAILGFKRGVVALLLYLVLGIVGLPVFADGAAGWAKLVGGSGGYLVGFVFAAGLVGYLAERGMDRTLFSSLWLMLIGTVVILIFGVGRLAHLYGFEKAMEYGFYPFWQGAMLKVLAGALVLQMYRAVF